MRIVAASVAYAAEPRGRRLDVVRDAHAEVTAARARLGLLGTEGVVVEHLERLLERLERRDAVVGHAVGVGVRQLVAAEQVPPPQLDGVHAHLPGGDVEQHLAGERLELPRSAVGGAADGVRVHGLGAEAGPGDAVGAGKQHADRGGGADRPRCRVGAAVGDEVDGRGLDRAVARRTPCATSACSCRDCPAASRFSRRSSTHLTGAPTFGAASIRHISSRWHHDLLTEAAAGVAHHHPDAVLRDAEQPRAEQPHLVGRLGGRVDGQLTGRRGVVDDEAATFHRYRRVAPAGRRSRSRRGRRWRTRRRAPTPGAPPARRRGSSRGPGARARRRPRRVEVVDDARQRLVVDVDELGCVLGEVQRCRRRRVRRGRRRNAPRRRRAAGEASRGSPGRPTCATAP